MAKESVISWRDKMPFPDLEFEHAVRELLDAIRHFKREPESKENQFKLFRAFQDASIQYNHVCRTQGTAYNNSASKLNKAAEETNGLLLKSAEQLSDVLQSVVQYSASISKKCSQNNKKIKTRCNAKKVIG